MTTSGADSPTGTVALDWDELAGLDRETVRRQRREKFLAIGRGFG